MQIDLSKVKSNVLSTNKSITTYMFFSCLTIQGKNIEELWLVDNGYNNYMMGNKDIFSSSDEIIKTQIMLSDKLRVNALGKGIFTIVTKKNEKKDINNVDYV